MSNEADDNRRVTNTCRYQNCIEKGEQAMLRRRQQLSGVLCITIKRQLLRRIKGIQMPAAQATNQYRRKAEGSRLPK